jgi:hypothetical protein
VLKEDLPAPADKSGKKKKGRHSVKTFIRVKRVTGGEKKEEGVKLVEKKRSWDEEAEMDVDEEVHVKLGRFVGDVEGSHSNLAGPADRSCGTQ